MSTKTKNGQNTFDQLQTVAQQVGLVLMTAAATVGMIEMPDHSGSKIILPTQPMLKFATVNGDLKTNPIRREKEEVEQHYVSYSVAQRTPARSGKH